MRLAISSAPWKTTKMIMLSIFEGDQHAQGFG